MRISLHSMRLATHSVKRAPSPEATEPHVPRLMFYDVRGSIERSEMRMAD